MWILSASFKLSRLCLSIVALVPSINHDVMSQWEWKKVEKKISFTKNHFINEYDFCPFSNSHFPGPETQLWYSINRNMLLIQVTVSLYFRLFKTTEAVICRKYLLKFFKLSPFSIVEQSASQRSLWINKASKGLSPRRMWFIFSLRSNLTLKL